MFETWVLVCMIGNPNLCHTLADLYGPYETKKECITRAYEIAMELPEHMPDYVAVKYKCLEPSDQKGKVNTNYGRDQEKNQKEKTQKYWNEGALHKGWSQETH